MSEKTIFALSTPPGRSGVAVIRVSGPNAWAGAKLIADRLLKPRSAHLCVLRDPVSRETIDNALVIGFRGPGSFTGEDVVEYHVHGGYAIVQMMLAVLGRLDEYVPAEPGEFTKRAFMNGKMDLTAAEAIADLIDAETVAQQRQAVAQMGGALSNLYIGWSDNLKRMLAYLEADLEFPDEDLPDGILPELLPKIEELLADIVSHLNDNRRGERLRSGVQVAVIGPPNAGKSSLVNALAQREVAIVSDVAGTTRDVIEVHLDLGGYPVILSDTAGLRPEQVVDGFSGHDRIEQEGIKRALERAESADLKVLLLDGASCDLDDHTIGLQDQKSILVVNKADVLRSETLPQDILCVSVKTGEGLDAFLKILTERVSLLMGCREAPALTRARHRQNLEDAKRCLERSLSNTLPELVAEDLRLAMRSVGRITGRVDVEDLLDVIFRDFCIGK